MRSKILILSCLLILLPATSPAGERRPPAPPYDLIRQGGSATCWILASMEALQYSGVDLSQQVQRVAPNRYRVHLYNYKNPKDRNGCGTRPETIPVFFNGKTTRQDAAIKPGDQRAYWVVALHRGVIQAVHEWDPSQTLEKTHGGGSNDAFGILTGRRGVDLSPKDANIRKKVEAGLHRHAAIIYGAKGHVYAVLKSSAEGLTLHDPYGSTNTKPWKVAIDEGDSFCILETR